MTGEGVGHLVEAIEERLSESFRHLTLTLPHGSGRDLSLLYRHGRILRRQDRGDGVRLEVEVNEKYFNLFRKYQVRGPG